MRIWECFKFFNEYEVLDIRLHEMAALSDVVLIVEAHTTYTGRRKPLNYLHHQERIPEELRRKIRYRAVELTGDTPWERDWEQWELLWETLEQQRPDPDDVIIMGDCDEVPRAAAIAEAVRGGVDRLLCLDMAICYFWLNCVADQRLRKAKLFPYRDLASWHSDVEAHRLLQSGPVVKDAGWNFGYTQEDLVEKLAAFAHAEYDRKPFNTPEWLASCRENGLDPFQRPIQYEFNHDPAFLPEYVRENREKFRRLVRQRQEDEKNEWIVA